LHQVVEVAFDSCENLSRGVLLTFPHFVTFDRELAGTHWPVHHLPSRNRYKNPKIENGHAGGRKDHES
jgi:hypothetical protein